MKKIFTILLTGTFLLGACSSTPKQSAKFPLSSKKGHAKHVKHDSGLSLEEIVYRNLSRSSGRYVKFQDYLKEHREFDIPYTHNKYVQKWLNYYQGRGRKGFARHLSRLGRFMPYIHAVAERYGVPKDLVYLSMIESGFNVRAKSWAAAVGPWQFIRSTGAVYGLNADYYVDERRDVEKATHAAIRHLKDLHNEFGHWYLAFAAYNAGSGKVNGAIRRNGRNYWNMVRGRYLRQETKDYVPKILAAATIAKNPRKYGFNNIRYQQPVPYEKVRLSSPTSLEVAATCAGVEPDLIRLLNPELLRDMTPPHIPNYELNIPRGTQAKFRQRYASLSPKERLPMRYHMVKKGESLNRIAKNYGIKADELAGANKGKIKVKKRYAYKKKRVYYRRRGKRRYRTKRVKVAKHSYQVAAGTKLTVPKGAMASYSSLRDDKAAIRAEGKFNVISQPTLLSKKDQRRLKKIEKRQKKKLAKLEKEESKKKATTQLAPLKTQQTSKVVADAKPQGLPLEREMAYLAPNEIPKPEGLQEPLPSQAQIRKAVDTLPGKQGESLSVREAALAAKPASPAKTKAAQPKRPSYYTVRRGDTLGGISRRFKVSQVQLKSWNGSKVSPVLKAGSKIKVNGSRVVKYKVRRGDSLYKIARQHSTTPAKLKKINGLKRNVIKPGEVLVIKK